MSQDCSNYVPQGKSEAMRLGSPPSQALDFVVVSMIGVAVIPFILGNLIILYHRNYRPIKFKRVNATVMSSVGGLIWIAATIVVNDHFGRPKNTFWTICTFWTFWLQLGLGFALWLNCLIVRMWMLYRFFIQSKTPTERHFWIVLLVLLLPVFIFCICASAQHASHFRCVPFNNNEVRGDCIIKNLRWAIGALVVLPCYFIILLVLTWKLRNIRDEFNEYSTVRNGGIIAFFLFFLAMVILSTKTYYQVTGRCFFTLAVSIEVFYFFWIRNWEPIYNVLFHKDTYLEAFEEKLRGGGLTRSTNQEQLDAAAVGQYGGNVQAYKVEDQHMPDVELGANGTGSKELQALLTASQREADEQRAKAVALEESNQRLLEELAKLRSELHRMRPPQSPGGGGNVNGDATQAAHVSPRAANGV